MGEDPELEGEESNIAVEIKGLDIPGGGSVGTAVEDHPGRVVCGKALDNEGMGGSGTFGGEFDECTAGGILRVVDDDIVGDGCGVAGGGGESDGDEGGTGCRVIDDEIAGTQGLGLAEIEEEVRRRCLRR